MNTHRINSSIIAPLSELVSVDRFGIKSGLSMTRIVLIIDAPKRRD